MSPAAAATLPLPDPLPLPAPGWLLWFLLILTFFLHIGPMNLVLGGSFLSAVTRLKASGAGPEGSHRRELVRWLTTIMPVGVAATVTTGVAPLLFLQVLYGRLFFSSAVLMGWFWLSLVALLIFGYYGTYLVAYKGASLGPAAGIVAWVSTLIFLAIGFLQSNIMTLMLRPQLFLAKYHADPHGLNLNFDDPTLIPRYLHFVLGAIAVSGMIVAFYGLWKRSRDAAFGAWAIRYGSLWFAIPTAVNLIVGFVWLLLLPSETVRRFMGGNVFATAVFGLGVILAVGVLVMMLLAVQSAKPDSLVRGSLWCLILTLVTMVLMRDQVRRGALEAAGFQPVTWVEPQWAVILIFAVLLVAALATVAWMCIALARGRGTHV